MQQEREIALSYSSLTLVWGCPHKHSSVTRYNPQSVLATSAQGSLHWNNNSTSAHDCTGMLPLEGKNTLEIIHGRVPARQHLHWGSPRDSTSIAKSCCETWSKERKMECLGFNAAQLTKAGDKLRPRDQILSWALRLFHGALEWFSYKLFLVQFLQTMTFYPSFFRSCINFTVKHLSSPISNNKTHILKY